MISTREATVTLDGVTTVTFDRRYPYFAVRNDSSAPVYISTVNADCTAGADGVVAVPKDGSGTVTIMGQYDGGNRFKVAQKGGGETVDITPTSLGYVAGAKMFYDGIYNFPPKHATNGNTWVDMVNSQTMGRYTDGSGSGLIASNHYIKQTGIATAMKIPDLIDYDRFTVELFVEITGGTTGENDIISCFDKAGFGIYTENGQMNASIRSESSGNYLNIATAFSQNTSYGLVITYDGQAFNFYVNGALVGTKTLSDYKKSAKNTYLGCLGAGDTENTNEYLDLSSGEFDTVTNSGNSLQISIYFDETPHPTQAKYWTLAPMWKAVNLSTGEISTGRAFSTDVGWNEATTKNRFIE